MEPKVYTIRMFREEHSWVAHCLEPDLRAEGPTPFEALEALGALFMVEGIGAIPDLVVH